MKDLKVDAGTLIIMSGISGSGKSTFCKQFPEDWVISSDEIRKRFFGSMLGFKDDRSIERPSHFEDGSVFEVIHQLAAARLRQRLTTVIDATNISDKQRASFVNLAKKNNAQAKVVILDVDVETILEQNQQREAVVSDKGLEYQINAFQKESEYPYILVNNTDVLEVNHPTIFEENVDAIGDVHGLLDDMTELLDDLGYEVDVDKGILSHPEGRKVLWMGDVIDRGPDSLKTLQFIRKAVLDHGHYMLLGNHEYNLLNAFKRRERGEPLEIRSTPTAKTATELMKLKEAEQKEILTFIQNLPHYYLMGDDFVFTHADTAYFNKDNFPLKLAMSGESDWGRYDSDGAYDELHAIGKNTRIMIRGHIPPTNTEAKSVFSLDDHKMSNGILRSLDMDAFKDAIDEGVDIRTAFENSISDVDCDFDYKTPFKPAGEFLRDVSAANKSNYIRVERDLHHGMSLYKYSKAAFWNQAWNEFPVLKETRGIVLDIAGNIVQHPFTKVFNYTENGAGLDISDNEIVEAVEKLNGFMGCITKHPYKNDLLITTSGSFESPFVEYIRQLITPKMRGMMLNYLSSEDLTLMFEVIHPDDPHIIEYSEEERGMYLIGARGKGYDDLELTENELDEIGEKLELRRANWGQMTFGEVKDYIKRCNIEGLMVRRGNETLLKFKSPYYLTIKFIARLGKNNTHLLFANPEQFKKKMDEEFYSLVDQITATMDKSKFQELMKDEGKLMKLVRKMVEKEREDIVQLNETHLTI